MPLSLHLVDPPKTGEGDIEPAPGIELDLNQPWREPVTRRRVMRAAIGSAIAHVVMIGVLFSLPSETGYHPMPQLDQIRKVVPLFVPPDLELTQKDPNKGKVSHELDVRAMHSAPRPQAPRVRTFSPPPGPVAQAKLTDVQPVKQPVIEAPKIEGPKIDVPKVDTPAPVLSATAPKPPPQDKPKLAFEDVGPSQPRAIPGKSAIPLPKDVAPNPLNRPNTPAGAGGAVVGDIGDPLNTPNSTHAPSPGDIKSSMQLLSDPRGVDFKPYMIQVLMAVRRNWLAILPESARMGRRGRTVIQFAIDRSGAVPKVVIAEGAGTDALDRAAVAAISASVPLPPLPAEYKGNEIRLQFAFSYNMPLH